MKVHLTFKWKRRASISDIVIFVALTTSSLIIRWNLSFAAYNLWNIGSYVNIAQMIMRKCTFYDPSWRLGMLANLNPLFPLILSFSSSLAGKTPWEVYPYLLSCIWSLAPFSTYYLTSRLISWKAGLLAGIVAVYPLNLPDQGPWILSMVFAPFLVLNFIRILEKPNLRLGVLFGLTTSIMFWSHMGTFLFFMLTFFIFTMILFGIRFLGALQKKVKRKPIKLPKDLHDIPKIICSIILSIIVFLSFNILWLTSTLELYGMEAFNAPLLRLSRDEALLESWIIYCAHKKYAVFFNVALLSSALIIIFLILSCLKGHCKSWIALLYFIVTGMISYVLLDPFQTFGVWFGPPYRYMIYLGFVCEVILGTLFDILFNNLSKLLKSKTNLVCVTLCGILLLLLTYVTNDLYIEALSRQEIPSMLETFSLPIKNSEAHVKAMRWLRTMARPSDIVAAEAPFSDRLRCFADVSTLSGFHYSTHIDPEKDKAVAIILYSDDPIDTVKMLKKYSVNYVYATTETVGTYELMVHWNELWKEKVNIAKLYALLGDPIYENNGIMIFRVPEDLRLRNISLPLNVDVKNRTIFGEDFENITDWTFGYEGVKDCNYFLGSALEITFTSKGSDIEHVYIEYSLSRNETPFIGNHTMLAVRHKMGSSSHLFAGPKLLISICVNGTWSDFLLHSEDWTTSYIYLSKFNVKGYLQAVRVGIWGHFLPQGHYEVYIDSLTITEATIIEA